MKITVLAAVSVLTFSSTLFAVDWEDVGPEEAWFLSMHDNVVTVDVSPMYDQGHIPGAVHAPLASLESAAEGWDVSATYLVYCHGDGPSRQGAGTLIDMGFESVKRLAGNYGAWVEAGYPVEVSDLYMDVPVELAKDLVDLDNSLTVVDVSPMYDQGHIPGAVSAPLAELQSHLVQWDPENRYLVYCHGEAPSREGAQTLVDAGFVTVFRLEGDYSAWVDAGYAVETN